MTQPGIEPRSPGPLANTLLNRPIIIIIIIPFSKNENSVDPDTNNKYI